VLLSGNLLYFLPFYSLFLQKHGNRLQVHLEKSYFLRLPKFLPHAIDDLFMPEFFVDSVNHWFGDREILSNVYINCKSGEVVGLLGRNGCGKSTLLKIIFGSIIPKFKYLKIDEKIYQKGYLSKNLTYLPQNNLVPGHISVSTAVDLLCKRYKPQLLEMEIVRKFLQVKFRELSGGEQRYLEVLLCMYSDSRFVLLDEPFSQLAPIVVEEIKWHINQLKTDKGFILTDHNFQSLLDVADRTVLLHNGCNYTIRNREDLILHGYLPAAKD